MDADDISYPRRLEKQLGFLEDHPEVDLTGGCAVVFADGGAPLGKRNYPTAHADIARRPLHWFKLMHPTFMGKTSWFRRYRYRTDAIRCEDMDLLFRSCLGSRFANLQEIVLGYRQGSLDLRKCLRGRWMWFHCSGRYLSGAERLQVGALEAFKSCWDVVAVAAHADAAWLRSRYAALNDNELLEWRQVWDAVS
jgi:hypothetical protein